MVRFVHLHFSMDEVLMQSANSTAAIGDADTIGFRVNPTDHPDLENIVLSSDGTCIESFDYNGHHFVIDWDELVGDEDEEELAHEQVMEDMRQYCEELDARGETRR
jgi:hypothetical protein